MNAAAIISGRRNLRSWYDADATVDFYDIKGAMEIALAKFGFLSDDLSFTADDSLTFMHSGKSSRVEYGDVEIGILGQLHPEISASYDLDDTFIFEMNLDKIAELLKNRMPAFVEISKFPFVERDFALLVPDDVPFSDISSSIRKSGANMILSVNVFDLYKGKGVPEGFKSLAVRVIFSCFDRTLTDDEVNSSVNAILKNLKSSLGVVIRT